MTSGRKDDVILQWIIQIVKKMIIRLPASITFEIVNLPEYALGLYKYN